MPDPTEDELLQLLRDTPGEPIPAPAQSKAWKVGRLVAVGVARFGARPKDLERRLDELVKRLGGGRGRQVVDRPGDLRRAAGRDYMAPHYWVDENQLDPSRRPVEEGWYDPDVE